MRVFPAKGRSAAAYLPLTGRLHVHLKRQLLLDPTIIQALQEAVVQAVRGGALPARVIQAARDELARRLKVPTSGLSDKKRRSLTTALQRIRDLYKWGELDAAEYRGLRRRL